jgi:nucleotide-binding universal stress UspA family protein
MYKKMLVPLDGSELAEVVFTYAKELAGRLNLDVVLLHVCTEELRDFAPMCQAYIDHAAEIIRSQLPEIHKKYGIEPEGKTEVRGEVVEGYPPEEILRYAEENKVDFILMATHGRSGIRQWTMGSVAEKITRASEIPIWLVRAGIPDEIVYDQWPRRTILVPLDGSEMAEKVLPHVETLAKQRGTGLVDVALLRVCEPPATPSYYAPEVSGAPLNWGEYVQQEMNRCKQASTEYLAGVEERFKKSGINVRSEVLAGKAADEIIDYAKKNPFNLIVMATHGRSGFGRLVYGSVARSVMLGVTSPIFLVKPE